MLKIKYNILLGLVALATFSSCKKSFLELDPPTSVSPDEAFATESDMLIALRGTYAGLRGADFFGRTLPVIGDAMADNAYQATPNTNRYTVFNRYTWTLADANITGIWTTGYSVILRANNIINNTSLPASATVDQYKGEAYAIRALSYFQLVRYFARPYTDNPAALGVPIITVYNPDLRPGRNTVAEVYTQMVKDLDSAYKLMAKPSATAAINSSQFSKYAAKGLQAKVYLTMGDNVNAKAAALDVITNSGFTVVPADGVLAYWNDASYKTNRQETLFEVSSDAVNNLNFDALSYLYSQYGNYGDFILTDSAKGLSPLFSATDARLALYPRLRRRNSATAAFVTAVNKYPAILGDRSDTKVLRLSEIYLIAAEASLPGNEPDALTYVNYITSRRNADPIASTGAQLFEDIITERRKELAIEGDRYLDLQRLKRNIDRPADYKPYILSIPYADYRRIFPIPQAELDVNPTIRSQQNTGYN